MVFSHVSFLRMARQSSALACLSFLLTAQNAFASDILIDSPLSGQQYLDTDGQKITVTNGGDLSVSGSSAVFTDIATALQIEVDTDVFLGGIKATDNGGSAISIEDAGQLSSIDLISGVIQSNYNNANGTIYLGGTGGSTTITLSSGTSISNSSTSGTAITSDTTSDTNLTIDNGGSIASVNGTTIDLDDSDGGSSYLINNGGTITSTGGNAIALGSTGNDLGINNSGSINGDISITNSTFTLNNNGGSVTGNISNAADITINATGAVNVIAGNVHSTGGYIALSLDAGDVISGNLSADGDVTVSDIGIGGASITGNLTSDTGNISLSFVEDDEFTGNIDADGNFTYNVIGAGSNTLTADTIEAGGTATFTLNAHDTVSGDVTAGSTFTLNGIGTGSNSLTGDITSTGGSVVLNVVANDLVQGDVHAHTGLTINDIGSGTNTFTGNLTSDTGNIVSNFSDNDVLTGDIDAGGSFTFNTLGTGGNQINASTILAGTSASFNLGANDSITGDITAGANITFNIIGTGHNTIAGNMNSTGGDVLLGLAAHDNVTGNITADGDVAINTYSTGSNTLTGDVTATNGNLAVNFADHDLLTGNLSAGGNLSYNTIGTGSNTIDATTITVGGTASFSLGAGDIVNGDISAASTITMNVVGAGGNTITGNMNSSGGSINLSLYANDTVTGDITADGNIGIGSYGAGGNSIAGDITSDSGDVSVSLKANDQITGNLSAAGDLILQSTGAGANTVTGNIDAGNDATIVLTDNDSITGNITAGDDLTVVHTGGGNISISGDISATGDLTFNLINSDSVAGNINTVSGQAQISLSDASSITGDINLGSNATSFFNVTDATYSGNLTLGHSSQSVDFTDAIVSGSINGPGRVQISSDPSAFDVNIGNTAAIDRLVIANASSLDMATNNNMLIADHVEMQSGTQLILGSASTSAAIDGLTPGNGRVVFGANASKSYAIGSTNSLAEVVLQSGVGLINAGDIIADSITLSANSSLISSSGVIGVLTAPITLSSGAALTMNGGSINGVIDGTANNNGALTIGDSLTSSQNIGTAHNLSSVAIASSGSFTNNAELHAQSLNVNGDFVVGSGSIDVGNITNSGSITASSGDAISMTRSNVVIDNAGDIHAGSAMDNAIMIDGDNVTLNILGGSNIIGSIASTGIGNALNFKTSVTFSQYDALDTQLVGDWTQNIASGGTLSIGSGETAGTLRLTGGTISNAGTIGSLVVSGAGNTLNLVSGSSTGNIANSGALDVSTTYNIAYADTISGNGTIVKTGSGRLELTGNNSYTGATLVSTGELKVNGSNAPSATTVASGARLSGTGMLGAVTMQSGSTLAAGNSVGTMNVASLNLNSGSITEFEFNRTAIDKIVASGNITVGGTAQFKLLDTDGYFTVEQDILESTGGTITGTFDTVTTDNGFTTNLTYGPTAVHARVSKTLNSNTLSGVLSSQNAVGRLVSKSLSDKLRNFQYFNQHSTFWIDAGHFDSSMTNRGSAAGYAADGYVTSAGIVANTNDIQLVGGIFNAQADVKRYVYLGSDDINSSGFMLGAGKNISNGIGNFYAFAQGGLGIYDFNATRTVNSSGTYQAAKGSGSGLFEYAGIGAAQSIPVYHDAEIGIFTATTVQRTMQRGWRENGLTSGNLDVSDSTADTAHMEIGASYKDTPWSSLKLPAGSFYKFEVTGYSGTLFSKDSAIVQDGGSNYSLTPTYSQKFNIGASALLFVPLNDNSTFTTRLDKRQNGNMREFIASAGYLYSF